MVKDNYRFNVRIYMVFILVLCVLGRGIEVIKLFDEMREKGCELNGYIYIVLIDYMGKYYRFNEVRMLFDEML